MNVTNRVFSNLVSPYDVRDYKIATVAKEFPETFKLDEVYVKNRLLELFELDAYEMSDFSGESRPVHEILEDLMKIAYEKGIMEDDTSAGDQT